MRIGSKIYRRKMAASTRPLVTVFSQVVDIKGLLAKHCAGIPVKFVDAGVPGKGFEYDGDLSDDKLKALSEAEILLTDPPLFKQDVIYKLTNLKWMQSTWAGVDAILDKLDRSRELPKFKLSRYAGVFGPHMAEYVIGSIIARERSFHLLKKDQEKCEWNRPLRSEYRLLSTLSIGILGAGDIGLEIARVCKAFGMTVWGLVRHNLPPEKRSQYINYYRQMSMLPELLENCDYVCNVLPSTKQTIGLLNGNVLESCKAKKSVFINVGRGNIITEESLVNAMKQGWLSGAILDVLPAEPLPPDSELWKMPQVFISPHISAITFADEVVKFFHKNYLTYENGEEVDYLVNWEQGY